MSYRRSSNIQDRFFACLTYLLPLIEVLGFGIFLFILIPPLKLAFLPLFPLLAFYSLNIGGIGIVQWGIFFALFLGVVQNRSLSYLLRFNAMQALLLGIFAALCSALLSLFGYPSALIFGGISDLIAAGAGIIILAVICSAIFVFVVGSALYSVIQTARGEFAKIPLISEAADSQVT